MLLDDKNGNYMRVFLYKTANPRFFGALGGTPVFQLPAAWAGIVLKHFTMAFFPEYVRRGPSGPSGGRLPSKADRHCMVCTCSPRLPNGPAAFDDLK